MWHPIDRFQRVGAQSKTFSLIHELITIQDKRNRKVCVCSHQAKALVLPLHQERLLAKSSHKVIIQYLYI
uniref:Uncharacterized protein n=1 Tax=Arundo donax TaxID=35708 RepID=A0A0A8ZBY8_ARUDO